MNLQQNIEHLKAEYAKVDKHDPKQLRDWFEKYSHLTSNDHAQIAGCSARWIRKLKGRAGIKGRGGKKLPKPKKLNPIPVIEVPEDWRTNKEWLDENVNKYGLTAVGKVVGRSRWIIKKLVDRAGATSKTAKEATRSQNPCYNKNWCIKHYVTKRMSAYQCAQLAGVKHQTFVEWLNSFSIPVRPNMTTAQNDIAPIWVRDLAAKLDALQTTRRVVANSDHIKVHYLNNWYEIYRIQDEPAKRERHTYYLNPENSTIENIPKVYFEYESGIDGEVQYPAHIIIKRSDLDKATLLEKRLAIHEFARILIARRWISLHYPDYVVKDNWERLKKYNPKSCYWNGYYTAFPKINNEWPGRRLMEHFFDPIEGWKAFTVPKRALNVLGEMLESQHDISTHNFLRYASFILKKKYNIPRLYSPSSYATIFKELNVNGRILDVESHFGNRAIAAALCGLDYTTPANDRFTAAVDLGLADLTGLKYTPYEDERVDWIIYDENFNSPDMSKIEPLLDRAKHMMVFCPDKDKELVMKYKPKSSIRIKTKIFNKTPDYIFIW